jgi:predicted amidohydrolase YtcJ
MLAGYSNWSLPMRQRLLPFIVAFASLLGHCLPADAQAPDLIVHHGKIITVDAEFRLAEAFAVRDGRIISVGKNDEILKQAGEKTTLLDVGGKAVIPGLCDSHVHPIPAALHEFDHPIPEMDSVADVLQYIGGRADVLNDGDWIVVSQVFITRLRDQRYPTRKELDLVAPKNPVLFATGPDASCNSLALQLSGIDKNFEIKDGQSGQIEKDPTTGEPTGILRNATRFVKSKSHAKSATADEKAAQLKKLLADYNAVGLTSLADRNASDESIAAYQKLKDSGELNCRVFLSYAVNGQGTRAEIEARIQKGAQHPLHKYDAMLWLRGVKVFLDGGMLTGSAYMKQPWGKSEIYSITDPEYRGLKFIQQAELVHMARFALKSELQFTAHSVGDGAIEALAEAYAEINKEFPVAPHRPCITHCNFMSLKAIQQMEQLGIVADLQPAWLWLDGATLRKQFGDERLTYFQPYKTLFEHGVRVGGGSDHMQKIGSLRSVNPYNPFLAMWVTLARQPRRTDRPLHPEQSITREQALRLYTINNAWLTFEEREKGSLEVGKLADFVVLQTDILECPVDDVKGIQVDLTYLGGRQVYTAKLAAGR